MRLRSIRPFQGWPAFFTEIVVVVIGVLIALGAQQMVDSWHWQREVADVRQAIDDEISRNLAGYKVRLEQSGCLHRRLAQLGTWADEQQAGRAVELTTPISRPVIVNMHFSVWEMSGDAVSRMPLKDRLAYAQLYGALRNYDLLRRDERDVWFELRDYEGTKSLGADRLFRLRGLITRARSIDETVQGNWPPLADIAKGLQVPEVRDPAVRRQLPNLRKHSWIRDMCQPLRWRAV